MTYPPCEHCGLGWPEERAAQDPSTTRPRVSFAQIWDREQGKLIPMHGDCSEAWAIVQKRQYSNQVRGKVTSSKRPFKGSGTK